MRAINQMGERKLMKKQTVKFAIYVLLGVLCNGTTGLAQSNNGNRVLKVGEVMPEEIYNDIITRIKPAITQEEITGKLLVLDFWGVNCGPCIASFPKMDTLQTKYKEKVKFVLVSEAPGNYLDSVISLRSKYSQTIGLAKKFPAIVNDDLLKELFPHRLIPHLVWIDAKHRVRAITAGSELTESNLNLILDDPKFQLPQKHDFLSYDHRKSAVKQLVIDNPEVLKYYSSIGKYIDGVSGAQQKVAIDSTEQTLRITRFGTILELFADALTGYVAGDPVNGPYFDYGKRVVLNTKDRNKLIYDPNKGMDRSTWNANNRYIYEAVLPIMELEEAYKYFLYDLERFFRKKGGIQLESLDVLQLVKIGDVDLVKYNGEDPNKLLHAGVSLVYTDSLSALHMKGVYMNVLKNELNKSLLDKRPVVDETHYTDRIEVLLENDRSDLESLKAELNEKYRLDLRPNKGTVGILVITDF
jgi:thiol-disulfide isomerase/thioredoxin